MKKRFLSLIIALAMMVGVFTPLIASAEGEVPTPLTEAEDVTREVIVHKILMSKENLENTKFPGTEGLDSTKYDGNQIQNLGKFFGNGSKEIAGVYFVVEKQFDVKKTTIEEYKKEDTDPTKKTVTEKVWKPVTIDGKQAKDDLSDALGGLTAKDEKNNYTALKIDTSKLPAGTYRINEVHSKSTYKGNDGKTLTDKKAVPTEITLPIYNEAGLIESLHVYPKNTEEKPNIDKNFAKAKKSEKELEAAEGFDPADEGAGIGVGADYKNYEKKKATAKAEIGKEIPYEVKTEIPAQTKWATAKWDDKMTEGLTYNKDLSIELKRGDNTVDLKDNIDYVIENENNGFVLKFTKTGLEKLNNQDEKQTVTLTYSATVNKNAIVDIPEANDITFHYGNTPSQGTTPLPTKPNENGQVTVNKTWDDGVWANGEKATFELRDANTGEVVKAEDLVYTGSETDTEAKKEFETYKNSFSATVELGYNAKDGASHTWKYLNKDKQYKAVEIASTTPSDAEYTEAKDGTIKVTDHKSNNPKPLNPTEPKVVNGGKKFVKTDQEGKRLEGAEFYVKDSTGKKYLVAKADDGNEAVKKAKQTLTEKQKAYENLDAEAQKGEEGQKAKKAFDEAQQAYNKAVLDNANKYEFSDSSDNAVVLRSDKDGKFEITGLAYGDYKLEEKTPPTGFAKLSGDIDFTVAKGSYETGNISYEDIKVVKENATDNTELTKDADIKGMKFADAKAKFDANKDGKLTVKEFNEGLAKNAQQIINKKVSIPQTGGIGTVIFTAIGLAIMASAIIAIKKRQATEAR